MVVKVLMASISWVVLFHNAQFNNPKFIHELSLSLHTLYSIMFCRHNHLVCLNNLCNPWSNYIWCWMNSSQILSVFAQILLMRSHIKCILSCTYIWKHPFAVIPKIGVHRKTLVLKSYFIETANLQFETCLEKTPA